MRLAQTFDSPELIDDGLESAPSRRIAREIPDYLGRKVSTGPLMLEQIGLARLREKCQYFDSWLRRLEALAGE